MPKTNEIAFNVRLLDVLQTKHPRWRDHVGVVGEAVHAAARQHARHRLSRSPLTAR